MYRRAYLDCSTSCSNEKEVHHMRDVKRLLWSVYVASAVSAACLAGLIATGFVRKRKDYLPPLARLLAWGGGLTVGLLVLFGIVASVGFDALFLLFHQISFANDFWQQDPRTDYLVLLFPQGFWFDATMVGGDQGTGRRSHPRGDRRRLPSVAPVAGR